MRKLRPGDRAPSFKLDSTSGGEVRLDAFRGKKLVLYFYPKDHTPGCTREACGFRDNITRLRRAGVEVLGVSRDSLDSHARFRDAYHLPFNLLSDPDHRVASAYGAYGEKTMYGRTVVGTIRSTFLIDEKGAIEAVWSPVRVDGHAEQVLAALAAPAGAATPSAGPSPRRTGETKKKTVAKAPRKAKQVKKSHK